MNEKELIKILRNKGIQFPQENCISASTQLCIEGFPIVSGKFITDNYFGMGIYHEFPHFWNEIPEEELFLDIAGYKFRLHQKHLSEKEQNKELTIWVPDTKKDYVTIERELTSVFK